MRLPPGPGPSQANVGVGPSDKLLVPASSLQKVMTWLIVPLSLGMAFWFAMGRSILASEDPNASFLMQVFAFIAAPLLITAVGLGYARAGLVQPFAVGRGLSWMTLITCVPVFLTPWFVQDWGSDGFGPDSMVTRIFGIDNNTAFQLDLLLTALSFICWILMIVLAASDLTNTKREHARRQGAFVQATNGRFR